jgi:hypothetical protein
MLSIFCLQKAKKNFNHVHEKYILKILFKLISKVLLQIDSDINILVQFDKI